MLLLKLLTVEGQGVDDSLDYSLPTAQAPGQWMPAVTDPAVGERGYQLVTRPTHHWSPHWSPGMRPFVAETRGAVDANGDGLVAAESVRLVEEVTPAWPLLGAFPELRVLLAWAWREAHGESPWPDWAGLEWINLPGAQIGGARLPGARLSTSYLGQADLSEADLTEADLQRANCRQARFSRSDLSGARLDHANLWDASLTDAKLRRASLALADLYGCNLAAADLTGASLRHADLQEAVLRRADLSGANLSAADLRGVRASGARFVGADLSSSNLAGARLDGADLTGADLTGTFLAGCDLTGARVRSAVGMALPDGWTLTGDGTLVAQAGGARPLDAESLPAHVRNWLLRRRLWLAAEVPAASADRRAWVRVEAVPETEDLFSIGYFEYDSEKLRYLRDHELEFEEWRKLGMREITVLGEQALEHTLRGWRTSAKQLVLPFTCGYPQ